MESSVTEDHHAWGARVTADRGVRFRIWAPNHRELNLAIEGDRARLPLNALARGWFQLTTDRARPGSRYQFELPDGRLLPDPASRFQPAGVHGPSEVIDTNSYVWNDAAWTGRSWHEAVVYELHVGTFTSAGSFEGVRDRLSHLVDLGVTALELMPIAQFPGERNWGYDGAYPFAPAAAYGRPNDLKALVDAAHQLNLMVLLDVVYNHFGPEGSYIGAYAEEFFTDRHETPWGAGINVDGSQSLPVRQFFIENALYWLNEFHFDGLRLDAVHAIVDESPRHLLDELAERVRHSIPDRHIHLILENEENEAHPLERDAQDQPVHFTAQWNDDVHHVLHTAATGEAEGYYQEYFGNSELLGRALAEGFAFQGQLMHFRGRQRGQPCSHLSPSAFVTFIQNHDQIGNRAFGERLNQIADAAALRAVTAVYLLLPQIPMLFMGEEWNAAQPFPFFCDFHGELAHQVREGRRAEFARFPQFQNPQLREQIPDPQAPETFQSAVLDWAALEQMPHREWLDWYRTLLALRRREITPRIPLLQPSQTRHRILGPLAVQVLWTLRNGEQLGMTVNLSRNSTAEQLPSSGRRIFELGDSGPGGPWSVYLCVYNETSNAPGRGR